MKNFLNIVLLGIIPLLIGVGIQKFSLYDFGKVIAGILYLINVVFLAWYFIKTKLNFQLLNIKFLNFQIGYNIIGLLGLLIGIYSLRKILLDGSIVMYVFSLNILLIILISLTNLDVKN